MSSIKEREKQIDEMQTDKGGFTKESLASIGVAWPPKKGWKKKYIKEGSMMHHESHKSPSLR